MNTDNESAQNERRGEFTYCGDLVGMSTIHAGAADQAYNFLNEFYTTVFDMLFPYDQGGKDRHVYMFSDSLIVTGDDSQAFVETMCSIYVSLLERSLLLRGGMVIGRLRFDPRRERLKFQKLLPEDDALARANALEKSVKGARFVIDSEIAHRLLEDRQEWLTLQGYINNPMIGVDLELQRSIVPLPNSGAFEILYPVYEKRRADDARLGAIVERMDYLMKASPADVVIQYQATIGLIQHSNKRRSQMAVRQLA